MKIDEVHHNDDAYTAIMDEMVKRKQQGLIDEVHFLGIVVASCLRFIALRDIWRVLEDIEENILAVERNLGETASRAATAATPTSQTDLRSAVKNVACCFFYWWHNRPGSNIQEGYDEFVKFGAGAMALQKLEEIVGITNRPDPEARFPDPKACFLLSREGRPMAICHDPEMMEKLASRSLGINLQWLYAGEDKAKINGEINELRASRDKMYKLLHDLSIIIKGEPQEGVMHSFHDLPAAARDWVAIAQTTMKAPMGAPAPFEVGGYYKTQGGQWVKFVGVHNEGTEYETMFDEDGVNRYTNRPASLGRVTASAHDYSDPRNTPPLYGLHPAQVKKENESE